MNTLEEGGNGLVSLDYSDLLTSILTIIKNQQTQNPFTISSDRKRLIVDIDNIASQVALKQIENPLGTSASSARSATVNFSQGSKSSFISQIQQIRDGLRQHLESALKQLNPSISLEQYVADLATDLTAFQGNTSGLGFTYPFGQYQGLQKQRLSLQKDKSGSNPLLKFHKLTITVENSLGFDPQLKASLQNFINIQFASESESERLELSDILDDLVGNIKSDFYHLKRLMDTEALGKLQREAKIRYLEFLKENLNRDKDVIYLEDLIRRLRLIEQYISDPDKEDGHYEVNYAGRSVNYRELFSRADAFDMLPIVPLIAGYLGETNDENLGKQQFIFGLKLKFGGKVQAKGGSTVFDYYLNLLDSESQEHKEGIADTFRSQFFVEKVLKILFLYCFVCASKNPSSEDYTPNSDLEYDPIAVFEEKVLPILKDSDDSLKQRRFRSIKKGFEEYKVNEKIEKLKQLLKKALKQNNTFQPRTYPLQIGVKQGILERDISTILKQGTFFKTVLREKPKEALKYIAVGNATVDTNSLCTLGASIQISDIQYFSTTDSQTFSMEYDLTNIRTIPIIVVPQEETCKKISENNFRQQKFVEFTYNYQRLRNQIFTNAESPQAFVYRFTFSLLAYTCLKVLLDSAKRLFIPILRLHLTDKQDPAPEEEFMRSFFSVLSHLLNEKHRSNSQGFCIKDINKTDEDTLKKVRGKIRNTLSSLYSILPKKFRLSDTSPAPQLDKLAIIVVSSRESDRSKGDDYKISNLLGEVVGVERQSDGSIRLYTVTTFSDNYGSQNMYTDPSVLIDEFDKLYQRGFKHFLYIAKSPYSSTLNMTKSEDDEKLFFMSKPLINSLKGNREYIKIYPVFFDQYYVVKLGFLKASSLYIQDTLELTSLVEDPSKKAVVFFNLFNGITVPGDERNYNGVISYATLLNIYEGILDDQDIRMGLMYDNPIKNDLLQYLTLFHFSRYEAAPKKNQNISLKLNPYQNIIGDDSVGALSIFNHMTGKVNFNLLAFLTQVRKALNVQPEDSQT